VCLSLLLSCSSRTSRLPCIVCSTVCGVQREAVLSAALMQAACSRGMCARVVSLQHLLYNEGVKRIEAREAAKQAGHKQQLVKGTPHYHHGLPCTRPRTARPRGLRSVSPGTDNRCPCDPAAGIAVQQTELVSDACKSSRSGCRTCVFSVLAVTLPDILQLTTNYRTHQGILNTAALVVDLLKVCA
jgi:hypothetical protein